MKAVTMLLADDPGPIGDLCDEWDFDVQVTIDVAPECGEGCQTDDGCSSTCASACVSV